MLGPSSSTTTDDGAAGTLWETAGPSHMPTGPKGCFEESPKEPEFRPKGKYEGTPVSHPTRPTAPQETKGNKAGTLEPALGVHPWTSYRFRPPHVQCSSHWVCAPSQIQNKGAACCFNPASFPQHPASLLIIGTGMMLRIRIRQVLILQIRLPVASFPNSRSTRLAAENGTGCP